MNCALWSSEVYETVDGSLQNVPSAASEWIFVNYQTSNVKYFPPQVVREHCFVLFVQTVGQPSVVATRIAQPTSTSLAGSKPKQTSRRTRRCTASSTRKNTPPSRTPEVSTWTERSGWTWIRRRRWGGRGASLSISVTSNFLLAVSDLNGLAP